MVKIRKAFEKPHRVFPYVREQWYGSLVIRYYQWKTDGGRATVGLDGYDLTVDTTDAGLGRTLLVYGQHEPVSSSVYRRELRALADDVDGTVRVFDFGSNVGYYALMPATDIDDVHVYAVEANAENYALLEENIERNGLSEKFTTDCLVLGNGKRRADMYVSKRSNCHSLNPLMPGEYPNLHVGTKRVTIHDARTWIEEQGLSLSDVHVLRMDIEGMEAEALRSLDGVLSNRPLLMHLEIHPAMMDAEDAEYVLTSLEQANLDIVGASQDRTKLSISSLYETREMGHVEVVLRG